MALIFNQPVRVIDIRGTIRLTTGTIIDLTPTNIVSYDIVENSASSGFALGEAQAATYTLVIDNVNHSYTAAMFNGANVQLELGIDPEDGSEMQYVPFGAWIIETSNLSRQSAMATLEGSDALATMFELEFADISKYPQTVGSLFSAVCGLAGVPVVSNVFFNSTVSIAAKPAWPEGTTLRGVIAYIAAVAGGFARMTRDGKLEIVSYADRTNAGSIYADTYKTIETGGGAYFDFNCLGVKYMEAEEYTRYTVADGADNASNTLQIDSNPLYTASIATSVKNALNGFYADGVSLEWVGDPTLRLGDVVTAVDTDGTEYTIVVNSQTLRYDGGLGASTASELATETGSSSGYVINEPALNAAGMLNGGKLIVGSVVTEKLAAQSITSEKIAAGAVNADKIAAGSVTAEKIASKSITAEQIAAGVIAAEAISAVKAALNDVTADSVSTSELYAAVAHIFELAADSIEVGDIETDVLAAAMAQIGTANIKRANISYAQIVDVFSDRIFTDSAIAGKFRADNLEVTQAQIVDLIVGSFRIVSGDGKVYNVTIDAEGNLKTEYLYDESEWMENGEIPDGYSAVAGNLTVGDVTAGNLYVSGAAEIMKLTAKWLVADRAWVNELTAGLIRSDLGERLNLSSNEAIVSAVERSNENQNDVTNLSTQLEQTYERFQLEINSKVGTEDLRYYLRYQSGTVELGSSGSRYKLQASDTGVVILQDNDVMTRMEQNTVAAPVFSVGRMLHFAPHELKVSASGVLMFN